ncbi:MAG: patatin [Hyphomicrobiales bacterium]|nr:patatin [Hyphomicrobiales bacterium]
MSRHLKIWDEKYANDRPRRLLACDGGGIKGIISLEILKEIEAQLAEATDQGDRFRLGEYFDYIAGTSTGAIIATGLAMGMSVKELTEFYVDSGPMMFQKEYLLGRLRRWYISEPLQHMLQDKLGAETELGSPDLLCLLMIVTQNATTGSPWPVTNNPFAKYNQSDRKDRNLQIPLWQLVRASTAAPVYFPPEILEWEKGNPDKSFVFVDGGVTPYNNPAFLLFRHAIGPQYRLNWETGENNMMLVSIGTGSADRVDEDLNERGNMMHTNAMALPSVLMAGASVDQDINCRSIGRCVYGESIDREVGDLIIRETNGVGNADKVPFDQDCGRAFLYARYDPDVSEVGLMELGLLEIEAAHVQAMDKVEYLDDMRKVGKAYAKRVDMSLFDRFAK